LIAEGGFVTRVLIAEDSRTQAEQLKLILEAVGLEVTVASDGAAAWEVFCRCAFDLVLSDIVMPGLTGYELCRKIKAHPEKRHVSVILLTTLKDPLDIVEGLECGADNFITKPYQADYLVSRVRTVLQSKLLRSDGKLKVGAEICFLGKTFTITSDKEQILDLLLSTFEEIVHKNRELETTQAELTVAKGQVERYARELESRARSSETKYQTLVEHANDSVFLLDPTGKILEVNRRGEQMLGRPREQIVGLRYEEFMLPAERRRFQRMLVEDAARSDNVRLAGRNKSVIYADISTSVFEIDGGRIVLFLAHDVTERNRLEQQLRQSQKMEAIGRLAGGVAHDFNNLLTIISGYSEMMLESLGPGDSARDLLCEISKAGERAASLTRQLLAFSRQQVLEPKVLDLNGVVADAERMLRRLIGEDIELVSILDPMLAPVRVDMGQIEQVILNLAVNARDAMPQGGKLTIETKNVTFDESVAVIRPDMQPGCYVLLAVSDNGCGMDEQTKAQIFEPFFTTKEVGKGTGLGLATVYGIVKQSGGHIDVYSEQRHGTSFKVYLPCADAPPGSKRGLSADGTRSPRGTETILVVEDEAAVRLLTRHALQMAGYTVLDAGNAADAIQLSEQHGGSIDLLITDVVMPQMGGRALAGNLAAARPKMKVLFVSGYTSDTVVRHGVLMGGVDFLQKPFTPTSLGRKVREVLEKHQAPFSAQDLRAAADDRGVNVERSAQPS
jgi:PAS domain S-box-containing protein